MSYVFGPRLTPIMAQSLARKGLPMGSTVSIVFSIARNAQRACIGTARLELDRTGRPVLSPFGGGAPVEGAEAERTFLARLEGYKVAALVNADLQRIIGGEVTFSHLDLDTEVGPALKKVSDNPLFRGGVTTKAQRAWQVLKGAPKARESATGDPTAISDAPPAADPTAVAPPLTLQVEEAPVSPLAPGAALAPVELTEDASSLELVSAPATIVSDFCPAETAIRRFSVVEVLFSFSVYPSSLPRSVRELTDFDDLFLFQQNLETATAEMRRAIAALGERSGSLTADLAQASSNISRTQRATGQTNATLLEMERIFSRHLTTLVEIGRTRNEAITAALALKKDEGETDADCSLRQNQAVFAAIQAHTVTAEKGRDELKAALEQRHGKIRVNPHPILHDLDTLIAMGQEGIEHITQRREATDRTLTSQLEREQSAHAELTTEQQELSRNLGQTQEDLAGATQTLGEIERLAQAGEERVLARSRPLTGQHRAVTPGEGKGRTGRSDGKKKKV
ncbi:MAG: hypothetical protein HQ596_07635 [Candidatus Saganbacteria bacterium]|nr:hypothetical protein [Candidatus Saganbacteria bacterium]